MAILDDFKARFPGIPTATADTYVPVLEAVWPQYFGGAYDTGNKEIVLQLLAHLVTVDALAGAGPMQTEASRSVGSVSVSFQAGAAAKSALTDFFRSTRYGQQYLLLLSQRGYGVVFA